ncbi:MAG: hypothetical protein K2M00_10145, partial [Muribaculaceae bacterium]|nr:hypothetical protein [Muribaculaceae bacterium]
MADLYAQVLIPRPLERSFTYRVPEKFSSAVGVGYRVVVPLGPRRFITGIVESLLPVKPADVADVKDIEEVLDTSPMVIHPQLKLWHWIADYYMCSPGDVLKAALPAGLKVESETVVELAEDADLNSGLSDTDFAIIEALKQCGKMSIKDINRRVGAKAESRVSRLVEAGIIA